VRGQEWTLFHSGPQMAGILGYYAVYSAPPPAPNWHVQIEVSLHDWMLNDTPAQRHDLVEAKLTDAVALAETLVH